MKDPAVERTVQLPSRIYAHFFAGRSGWRSAVRNFWPKLLVSFRSGGAKGTGNEAGFAAELLRHVLLPVARGYARLLRRYSAGEVFVPTQPIAWVNHLEANWKMMRDELDRLRGGFELPALVEVIPGEQYVADKRWRMFIFRYFGRSIAENCALCPRTAALLEQVPGLISANFSVLQPGARLAAHHGLFAGVLRYHLGLIVPERADHCALRVDGEIRHWQEGASLLFDDTRRHEAWNATDQDRVILLLDVRRQLPRPLCWINDALLAVLSRLVMPQLASVERMLPSVAAAALPISDERSPVA